MTYHELAERSRIDLKDSKFFGFDLSVPNSEAEYQEQLAEIRETIVRIRSRKQRNNH